MTRDKRVHHLLSRDKTSAATKHWIRLTTMCSNACVFCLDSVSPRDVLVPVPQLMSELEFGRQRGASAVVLSGGEASLHPSFAGVVAAARDMGYSKIQTITNGRRFADVAFYERCVSSGLNEITFSLHGHTTELHDSLTATPGSFNRLVRALHRATQDRRVIANVDIVINKKNVAVLDKIVELAISLGVNEFDLLHIVPHGRAFDHRTELFYDPEDHLETLHKVFKLNRHPSFCVWTNRFPAHYLEGLEDLIQDPRKILDEVNGRRAELRRLLDQGVPLDCAQPERCALCFVEPFCRTLELVRTRINSSAWDVWAVEASELAYWRGQRLPFGCSSLGLTIAADRPQAGDLLHSLPELHLHVEDPLRWSVVAHLEPATLVIDNAETLASASEAALPNSITRVIVVLNQSTAPWLLSHRSWAEKVMPLLRLHQPTHETLAEALDFDVEDPRGFFTTLDLPAEVSGLPSCLAPGCRLVDAPRVLPSSLVDPQTGRIDLDQLAHYHIAEHYRVKSLRCRRCPAEGGCHGIHINMARARGFGILEPLLQERESGAMQVRGKR